MLGQDRRVVPPAAAAATVGSIPSIGSGIGSATNNTPRCFLTVLRNGGVREALKQKRRSARSALKPGLELQTDQARPRCLHARCSINQAILDL